MSPLQELHLFPQVGVDDPVKLLLHLTIHYFLKSFLLLLQRALAALAPRAVRATSPGLLNISSSLTSVGRWRPGGRLSAGPDYLRY